MGCCTIRFTAASSRLLQGSAPSSFIAAQAGPLVDQELNAAQQSIAAQQSMAAARQGIAHPPPQANSSWQNATLPQVLALLERMDLGQRAEVVGVGWVGCALLWASPLRASFVLVV